MAYQPYDEWVDDPSWKVYDDVIQALVGLRDSTSLHPPMLKEEKTIQGWIDFCSEIMRVIE